ncbi:MAG TPA: protein kinase [Polyangia bacterium]|nr:protein kinase [Polyangia bacterium]
MNALVGGRYQIVGHLGAGGTSLVQRARDLRGGPDVALKQLRPEFSRNPALRRRFQREGNLVRQLNDTTIVRVIDVGEEADGPFLVLELVEGPTLRQLLDQGRKFDPAAVRTIMTSLTRALDQAHAAGIVHRDVKPANIFVEGWTVRLGGFGNARVVSLASVTGASLTWGTPEYVAPELFSRGRADPRSDFYAVGVILHEMLTGRPPWSRSEILGHLTSKHPPLLSVTGAGEEVDRLIADLLAPEPSDRPASGREIMSRLSEPSAVATVSKTACSACGEKRPDDVPRCFSCGQEVLRIDRTQKGGWRLVLRDISEDAATTEKLLWLLSPLSQPTNRPLLFLTGNKQLYSESERKQGIDFPAVLFSGLGESAARDLESLFRAQGFDVEAVEGEPVVPGRLARPPGNRANRFHLAAVSIYAAWTVHFFSHSIFAAGAAGAALIPLILGIHRYRWRASARKMPGLFRLKDDLAPVPIADYLLSGATKSASQIQAPEARAIFVDLSTEIYRLTRRAAELDRRAAETGLQSTERELVSRALLAAPALVERLRRLAKRLDGLDAALNGTTDGELMASIARLERAAAAPGAEQSAIEDVRSDLEATLERREATELERARLSAKLCELLGRLRTVYQRVRSLRGPEDEEATTMEQAAGELDAFLAERG